MFNWVVKVVPQPAAAPEEAAKTSAVREAPKNKEVKNAVLKTTEEVSEDGQVQAGVMGWLSNGFSSALPQPPGTGRLSRANSDARQPGEDGERSGVISWVTQGLTKVLPQPDAKYKEEEDTKNNEEHTEVYEVATMPDYDPLPHIPVVEMVSEDEASEVEILTPHFPPKVVNWIKQIIPQPVMLPPGAVPSEPPAKASRSSLDKILSPPPESLSAISLDTDNKPSGVVDWFVSGLGLKMPQLVLPSKDEAEASGEVLKKASTKLNPDMVLEDLESDNEVQQKQENKTKSASPSPSTATQQPQREEAPQKQPNSSMNSQMPEAPTEGVEKGCQEDAETQTGRWTPFIESIKKDAEDVALATMEERLLHERVEMTRLAEEVARQTAEMAVRQMASEGTSIKLSLESQELLEEPEAELLEPQEEEEDAAEQKEVTGDEADLPADQKKDEKEDSAIEEPEPEKASEPEPEPQTEPAPEPETPNQEDATEAQPVTQQPQKAEDAQVPNADKANEKEAEAAGDDCGESRPAVNVEDVDHEKAGGGGVEKIDASRIPALQDPKLTTLTVPMNASGGRQSKGDKE